MTTITIELPTERAQRLQEMASKFGLSVQDLARIGVEDLLGQPDEEFQRVVQYMLKKNAELYKQFG